MSPRIAFSHLVLALSLQSCGEDTSSVEPKPVITNPSSSGLSGSSAPTRSQAAGSSTSAAAPSGGAANAAGGPSGARPGLPGSTPSMPTMPTMPTLPTMPTMPTMPAQRPVPTGGKDPSMLPTPKEPCPTMATGTVMMLGIPVSLQVGAKVDGVKGPLYIGWGGAFGSQEILSQGGVIAGITRSNKQGLDTGNSTWYTGDYDTADQVVACAIEQLGIDPRRIWTGGHSSGGLQAGTMAIWRSGYLAAAVPSSGGISPRPGLSGMWQDPSHVPAVMTMHGAKGKDVVVIEFADASMSLDKLLAAKGGFAIDCDHGGGHEGPPAPMRAASWEFLQAHPYGVDPEPYAGGLPMSFPTTCQIVK